MSDTSTRIDAHEAARLISLYHVVKLLEVHPACVVYALGNGQRLTYWDGDSEYGREWELD